MKEIFLLLFGVCLLRASLEDWKSKRVRRLNWWIAGSLGIGMIIGGGIPAYGILADLVCFGALQFLFFSKMYGKADVYAFVCCSFVLASFGGGMKDYLIHMLVSVIFLGVVQLKKGNIAGNGNLRHPVAFIPYISSAFLTCILARAFL